MRCRRRNIKTNDKKAMTAHYNTKPEEVKIIHTGNVTQVTLALNARSEETTGEDGTKAIRWTADFTRFSFNPSLPGAPSEEAIARNPSAFLALRGDIDTLRARYMAAVQDYMDKTAQAHGYDNIFTACTYATSTDPTFRAEGQACVAWRDAVWVAANRLAAAVMAGGTELPDVATMLAQLPQIEWPRPSV